MGGEKLPKSVVDFIAENVDSALQLEILLLLHARPDRAWTAEEIDAELRINRDWIAGQLTELCRRKLLHCLPGETPAFRYDPHDAALASAVDLLATWYKSHRVAIISLIYSKPSETLKNFADAFRIRKDVRKDKPNG